MIIPDGKRAREAAAATVADGGVVAFRTDTFYGLGADPFNREALLKIFALKGREEGKPILVVISDEGLLTRFSATDNNLLAAVAKQFWPGALTIVLNARDDVPKELTAGTGTVGVRLPDDNDVREFIRTCGGTLTATSANPSGQEPARRASDVEKYFGMAVDLIVDGGNARSELPSTVLDLSKDEPRLIREGVVSRKRVQEVLEKLGVALKQGEV